MMLSEGASIDAEFLRTIPGKSSCPVAFDASTDWRRAVMSSVETGANSVNAGASRSAGHTLALNAIKSIGCSCEVSPGVV